MSQSLTKNYIHLIFSTKERRTLIETSIKRELHAYIISLLNSIDCQSIQINSMPDHLHLLYVQSKNQSISQVVQKIKRNSSLWVKQKYPDLKNFKWQAGYAAFSVSQSQVQTVKRYIKNQEFHHKQRNYKQELKNFLEKYELEYEEKYL